ncbi:MAG TPA: hypothetical protein VMB18_07650 [Terriglobales bacterium]|nr:hypothetical protein [Terriglobales bacterium]
MCHPGINSNINFPAPLAAMGFLAACAGTVLSGCALIAAAFVGKLKIARIALSLLAGGAAIYLALLLFFSLASHETILARGQEKYFCEIDCHLAYSIVDVKRESKASVNRYILEIKTRFDEKTISSNRPIDAPLMPSPRTVDLIDANGAKYPLEALAGTALTTSLIPGESYLTQVSFSVPSQAKGLKLFITTTPQWPDLLVIGDENSWLHKKTYLAL